MSEQINISSKNIEGKCDLKCSYNFQYKDYNSTATNGGFLISIRPQETGDASVTFNKKKYRVNNIALYAPSRHLYNDNLADAEISIIHMPENGGKPLSVSIPIRKSSETNSGTDIITEVINDIATSAPARNTRVNIGGFNLQKIVPNKPFINYESSFSNNIAFTLIDAIPISSATLDKLKQVITPNTQMATGSGGLFYNSSGPNSTKELGDGIYISCNPTGSSTETEDVMYEKEDVSFNFRQIIENPIFIAVVQIFFACFIMIIVFYVWNYGFMYIDGEHAEIKSNTDAKPN